MREIKLTYLFVFSKLTMLY